MGIKYEPLSDPPPPSLKYVSGAPEPQTETSLVVLILFFETDCSAKSCGVTMRNLSVKEKEIVKRLFPVLIDIERIFKLV